MKPLRVLASPCHPQSLALNSVMLVVHQSPLPSPSSSWASGLISDTGLGDCSSPPHQITSPALPRARGQQVQNQIDMPMGVTHWSIHSVAQAPPGLPLPKVPPFSEELHYLSDFLGRDSSPSLAPHPLGPVG